jgi:hypothetical protein
VASFEASGVYPWHSRTAVLVACMLSEGASITLSLNEREVGILTHDRLTNDCQGTRIIFLVTFTEYNKPTETCLLTCGTALEILT